MKGVREFFRVTFPWSAMVVVLFPIQIVLAFRCGDLVFGIACVALPLLGGLVMLAATSDAATRVIDSAYRSAAVRRVDARHAATSVGKEDG